MLLLTFCSYFYSLLTLCFTLSCHQLPLLFMCWWLYVHISDAMYFLNTRLNFYSFSQQSHLEYCIGYSISRCQNILILVNSTFLIQMNETLLYWQIIHLVSKMDRIGYNTVYTAGATFCKKNTPGWNTLKCSQWLSLSGGMTSNLNLIVPTFTCIELNLRDFKYFLPTMERMTTTKSKIFQPMVK